MKEFKTKKANLLFVVLPKDALSVCIDDNDICFIQKCITKYIGINKGYTLLGKLSEVSEEVAKGLVDEDVLQETDLDMLPIAPPTYHYWDCTTQHKLGRFTSAIPSLNSIATHLGMELTDNIYILKRI